MNIPADFTKDVVTDNEPIIIYGASMYGEIAYKALKLIGLEPLYFCDKAKSGTLFFNVPVISPNELAKYKSSHILIASSTYFYDIREVLDELGCKRCYSISKLISMLSDTGQELRTTSSTISYLGQRYNEKIASNLNSGSIDLLTVQIVVTEKCTLRCRNCISFMQYYEQPENHNLLEIKCAFDKFLDCIDSVAELNIIGGEPFINKDLYKLIEWYADNPKIKSIIVLTNGMIIPNEKTLKALKNKKVGLEISDYGNISKNLPKFIEIMKKENIHHCIKYNNTWHDLGELKCRNYTTEQVKEVYQNCEAKICTTFLKGKLYHCPPSAHSANLKAVPKVKEDYVDFNDGKVTIEELREQIKKLMYKREYVEACGYCNGRNPSLPSIPAAVQAEAPITYTKLGEE